MSDTCVNHIENYWKILTEEANESFNEGNYEVALSGYLNALYRAEVLNSNFLDCVRLKVPFVQLYVVSCNNLANCYQEIKDLKNAEEMLQKVIYFLLYLYEKNYKKEKREISELENYKKEEIQGELKKSVISYINFIQKNNLDTISKTIFLTYLKKRLITNNLENIKTFDYVQFN